MAESRTYRHVMVALDQAEDGHRIAERAADVAGRYGARVTLLHVVDQRALSAGGEADVPLFGMEGGAAAAPTGGAQTEPQAVPFSTDDRLLQQARGFLGAVVERLGDVPIDTMVVPSATVGHAIVVAARRQQADLLVCGAHHRHGLALFLPSPVDGVVHHLPCDLLLVRLP